MISLNVTIFGAGAMCSMLLEVIKHEGKATVNLFGRKPHMEAIDRNGLTLEFVDENKKGEVEGRRGGGELVRFPLFTIF